VTPPEQASSPFFTANERADAGAVVGGRSFLLRTMPIIGALTVIAALNGQTTISVMDHRPLAGGLDILEKLVGSAINYEDVPYQNPADLEDLSTPEQKAADPGYQLLVPRKGHVAAAVYASSGPLTNANSLLSSYRQNSMPGDFVIEQANAMTYVIASKVQTQSSAMTTVRSPMKALITVPNGTRSVAETIMAILDSIYTATNTRITLGAVAFFPTETVSFGAAGIPARDAVAQVLAAATKTPASYRLLYDPATGYMLNLHSVLAPQSQVGASPQPPQNPSGVPGLNKNH
jgi:hypothetical protein